MWWPAFTCVIYRVACGGLSTCYQRTSRGRNYSCSTMLYGVLVVLPRSAAGGTLAVFPVRPPVRTSVRAPAEGFCSAGSWSISREECSPNCKQAHAGVGLFSLPSAQPAASSTWKAVARRPVLALLLATLPLPGRSTGALARLARARRPPKKSVSRAPKKSPAGQSRHSLGRSLEANPLAFNLALPQRSTGGAWSAQRKPASKPRSKRFRRHCGSLVRGCVCA